MRQYAGSEPKLFTYIYVAELKFEEAEEKTLSCFVKESHSEMW